MPDLSTSEVQALLRSLGLEPQDDEDLQEVTHRINAFNEALTSLEPPELQDAVGPSNAQAGRS